jgi:hypothetical protein
VTAARAVGLGLLLRVFDQPDDRIYNAVDRTVAWSIARLRKSIPIE